MPPFPREFVVAAGNLDPALSNSENLANCRGLSGILEVVGVYPAASYWELTLDQAADPESTIVLASGINGTAPVTQLEPGRPMGASVRTVPIIANRTTTGPDTSHLCPISFHIFAVPNPSEG